MNISGFSDFTNELYPILTNIINMTVFVNDEYRHTFNKNLDKTYFKEFIYHNLNNY